MRRMFVLLMVMSPIDAARTWAAPKCPAHDLAVTVRNPRLRRTRPGESLARERRRHPAVRKDRRPDRVVRRDPTGHASRAFPC